MRLVDSALLLLFAAIAFVIGVRTRRHRDRLRWAHPAVLVLGAVTAVLFAPSVAVPAWLLGLNGSASGRWWERGYALVLVALTAWIWQRQS